MMLLIGMASLKKKNQQNPTLLQSNVVSEIDTQKKKITPS